VLNRHAWTGLTRRTITPAAPNHAAGGIEPDDFEAGALWRYGHNAPASESGNKDVRRCVTFWAEHLVRILEGLSIRMCDADSSGGQWVLECGGRSLATPRLRLGSDQRRCFRHARGGN
jgi:hypothetical protein